ncbi:MAG: hypothetical protein NC214_08450 [Candidatus Amulumruptor caecigallinarius]|nr:hypothetical protein [Candidatus Amulumruptor caecigallinarius]
MKYIIPILLCLMMVSCHTSKQATPPTPTVTLNDSQIERIVTRTVTMIDTVTVYVEIPAQSVEQVVNDTTSHVETDFAESDAWINSDGTLGHNIRNKPQKVPAEAYVPNTTTETEKEKEVIKEVPVPYPDPYPVEKDLTTWQHIKIGTFWYLIAVILAGVGWIFRKPLIASLSKCF